MSVCLFLFRSVCRPASPTDYLFLSLFYFGMVSVLFLLPLQVSFVSLTDRPGTAAITVIGPAETPWLVGANVTLICTVEAAMPQGNPVPSFRWTRLGSPLSLTEEGTLHLRGATNHNNGIYICTPYNLVGQGRSAGALLSFQDSTSAEPTGLSVL